MKGYSQYIIVIGTSSTRLLEARMTLCRAGVCQVGNIVDQLIIEGWRGDSRCQQVTPAERQGHSLTCC